MSIHDWTRVDDGIFHDFHLGWIVELQRVLNNGLLPPKVYALSRLASEGDATDLIAIKSRSWNGDEGRDEGSLYASLRREIAIHDESDHRVLALIEMVSPGTKSHEHRFDCFIDRMVDTLRAGIHLLIVDLHPPGRLDPNGVHQAIWERTNREFDEMPRETPLMLVAYIGGKEKRAYLEPTAVGNPLSDMPLFLKHDLYVTVPLEATYQGAYEGVPQFYRKVLEGGPS